jgi:hypothetical protein
MSKKRKICKDNKKWKIVATYEEDKIQYFFLMGRDTSTLVLQFIIQDAKKI